MLLKWCFMETSFPWNCIHSHCHLLKWSLFFADMQNFIHVCNLYLLLGQGLLKP